MKLDTVIRKYGREVMEALKGCTDSEAVRQVISQAGFQVTDGEVKDIAALMTMVTGDLRELSLDELSQVTGGRN